MSARRWIAGTAVIAVAVPAGVAFAAVGDLTRVSVKNDGSQSTTGGFRGVTSGNGRYVAFVSAENLTGVSTGGKLQVFVRDRTNGTTILASTSVGGVVGNDNVDAGDFFNPAIDISADGRYVVFGSDATNLVDADTNGKQDVFRKNLTTGDTVRLSVTSAGEQGNQDSGDPSVSGDGSRTAFRTSATNILPGVTVQGVALRDTVTNTTTLVSSNTAGVQANDSTERPAISADGSTVAFEAGATTTNLYPNDTNATNDIIVKTLATGTAVPAAVKVGAANSEGANVGGGNKPDISGTGRYVVFESGGILDAVNDTNGANDVYVRDLQTGTTTLASARNGLAAAGDQGGTNPAIGADGARVAFQSSATNLIAADGNAASDVFARTLTGQTTVRLSERANGSEVTQGSETPGIAGNGGLGVFTGQGAFAADDTNGATDDVYVKELQPTDAAPPVVALTVGTNGISGKVEADPSGLASLRVNGTLVRPAADGTFTAPTAAGAQQVAIAIDGAGNVGTATAATPPTPCIDCNQPPVFKVDPKVTLAFKLQRRAVSATITANAKGKAKVYLQRAIRRGGKIVYVRSGKLRIVTLKVGKNVIALARPKRAGTYRLRVVATFDGNKLRTASRLVRLR